MNAAQLFTLLLGTFAWFGLVGFMGIDEVVLGVLVIGSSCWLTGRIADTQTKLAYRRIPGALLTYGAYVLLRVLPSTVLHSLEIARVCLARRPRLRGAIVAVELPDASPEALVALSLGIAFSPDRQIVHIDRDARVLYIHAILPPDPNELRAEIRRHHERYTRRATP